MADATEEMKETVSPNGDSGSRLSSVAKNNVTPLLVTAAAPPTSCMTMNIGTDDGAMPAKVLESIRATSIIGLAKLVDDDHQ